MRGYMNATREAIHPPMTLEEYVLVRDGLASVNDVIRARLKCAVPLVDQIAEHIISGGGKRLQAHAGRTRRACLRSQRRCVTRGGGVHRVHSHSDLPPRRRRRTGLVHAASP